MSADTTFSQPQAEAPSLAVARLRTERDMVLAALDRNGYNMAATARELGVSRVTLYRIAQRLAIEPGTARAGRKAAQQQATSAARSFIEGTRKVPMEPGL